MKKIFSRMVKSHEIFFFLGLISVSLLLRLLMINAYYHVDILSCAGWGKWIYEHGPMHFYENTVWIYSWPTQPPLVNLIYAWCFNLYDLSNTILVAIGSFFALHHLGASHLLFYYRFLNWWGQAMYKQTPFKLGQLIMIKLIAVIADIGIGIIIYFIARKMLKPHYGLFFASLYLLLPISWYISSLWGEYDQLSFLFLLLSFLVARGRFVGISPLLFLISVEIKPSTLIFIPLLIYMLFASRKYMIEILLGCLIAFIITIFILIPFTDKNIFNFLTYDLVNIIFNKSEYRVGGSSFNFWRIVVGDKLINQNTSYFLLPAKIWSIILVLLTVAVSLWNLKSLTAEKIMYASFILGFGSILFLTNMLERYLFAGIVFGLIFSIYQLDFLKYWVILALSFTLSLIYSWMPVNSLSFVHTLLFWGSSFGTRLFSMLNVIIYLIMVMPFNFKSKKYYLKESS